MANFPYLKHVISQATVVDMNGYHYPMSPFGGVDQPIQPQVLTEIADAVAKKKIMEGIDLMVTFESAGSLIAASISQKTYTPFIIARKRKFAKTPEINFWVKTNFDKKQFYIYGDLKDKLIVLVDDVVASGETLKQATLALEKHGAKVKAMVAVIAKNSDTGRQYQDTFKDFKVPLIALVKIKVGKKIQINE